MPDTDTDPDADPTPTVDPATADLTDEELDALAAEACAGLGLHFSVED